MAQAVRRLESPVVEAVHTTGSQPRKLPQAAPIDVDDGLLATAGPLMAACYAAAMVILAGTFWQHGEAMFVIAISAGFAAIFFTLPFLMLRIQHRRDGRWVPGKAPAPREVTIFTGNIHRNEAIVQMVIVPMAMVAAFTAFAIIWLLVGPGGP